MENKNIWDDLTRYRVKLEKDGKSLADLPGILCLPALFAAPALSIGGLIAAPLLGYNVRLENEEGKGEELEKAVKETAEAVMNAAEQTVKTVTEEIDKALDAISLDDPKEEDTEEQDAAPAEKPASEDAPAESGEKAPEDLKKNAEDDIPTIEVKPDDSAKD